MGFDSLYIAQTTLKALFHHAETRFKRWEASEEEQDTKPGRSSNFNAFLNMKLAELKKSEPTLSHAERLKQINDLWKVSSKDIRQTLGR
ncbi:BQ5605_C008g05266 [Microbotryum silenes-dioicae]|uniref:BQ5605_C008g05266 protein n=1 Tax=Microbotryum silenes-dioicae TaxID=796604 RepID=A0A2X0MCI4_9BASI|nr:BQ5605_C008g05266 [Microbotryum silenes-dioicae]